jgi:hypothetical protein
MWRATNPDGTLTYSFVESLNATYPYYLIRLGGGLLVVGGMLLMGWNVLKTLSDGRKPACPTATTRGASLAMRHTAAIVECDGAVLEKMEFINFIFFSWTTWVQ